MVFMVAAFGHGASLEIAPIIAVWEWRELMPIKKMYSSHLGAVVDKLKLCCDLSSGFPVSMRSRCFMLSSQQQIGRSSCLRLGLLRK